MKKENQKDNNFEIGSDNIFADLELKDSDELIIRAELLREISSIIKQSKLTQKEIGNILGISQPKVSQRLSAFSTWMFNRD